MLKIIVLLLSFLSFSAQGSSQASFPTYFKEVSSADGLPDNSVNVVTEDHYGSIWVGTWNGLARFDGRDVEVFRHSESDTTSLHNNMVRALYPYKGGIFVGSDYGLDFYSFGDGRFMRCGVSDGTESSSRPLTVRISRLCESGGYLFAVTSDGDILRYDPTTHVSGAYTFKRLPRDTGRRYADMCRGGSGRLLALSNDGITVFDRTGEIEITMNRMPFKFSHNLNIFCDTLRNEVYVGGGIGERSVSFVMDDKRGSLRENSESYIPSDLMATILDNDGNVVFATDGGGVVVKRTDGDMDSFTPGNSTLLADVIYSLYCDRRENLWCGSYRRGLFLMSSELNRCRVYDTRSAISSFNIVTGMVKIGSKMYLTLDGGGLDIYDVNTGERINRNSGNSEIPGNNVTSLVRDGDRLWMTVYSHGLVEYDIAGDSFVCHRLDERVEPGNLVWTLADDGYGHIIVGGRYLHSFDKASGSFRELLPGEEIDVMSIVRREEGIWVGSRLKGAFLFSPGDCRVVGRWSDFSESGTKVPSHCVECIYPDSKGRIWLSLGNAGLCSMSSGDPKGEVRFYGSSDGLSETRVRSIVEDPDGNLWLGTVNGLFRYIRSQDRFVKVQGARIPGEYTSNAAALIDGEIFMGTISGLVSLPYSYMERRMPMLPTLISRIDILGAGERRIPLYGTGHGRVDLASDEDFFTVSFSVPEMTHPDNIQIECFLEGFDQRWRNVTDTRRATYTNVPPGEYVLKVRHAEADGEWSDEERMTIVVRYPWYLSVWALVLWGLLASGIIITVWRLRKHYVVQREKAAEAQREKENERRLTEAKLDFFAGISHELRTPCFLISAQIEEIVNSGSGTVSVGALKGIYRNSLKLNKLIGNVMDIRKMETGNLNLLARDTDVTALLRSLMPDYEGLCRQKGLYLKFDLPNEPLLARIDPDKIEFIMTNLITNAYKYTPSGKGGVTVSLTKDDSCFVIKVNDTGIGIVKDMQEAIFNPFFRTERGRKESVGDGIGLSFVRKLVELHDGEISVESEVNVGTTFIVKIPLDNKLNIRKLKSGGVVLPEETPDDAGETVSGISVQGEGESVDIQDPTATHSILIVEDDEELRRMLSRSFGSDYKVKAVATGEEGIELGSGGHYDIILTDIMLPGKDGHDVIRAVKGEGRNADVKVIVLSSLSSDDEMLRAYQEGADMYLSKPISLKMLRHHVSHLHSEQDISLMLVSPSTQARNFNQEERKFLLRCRTIINESLMEEDFGIETLARKLAMSHSSLYKKIKGLTGVSIIEFINEYKICKAVALFRQGMTNVQTVGEMCGFRDIKTFREAFKKRMNMPPKQFIQSLSRDDS